MRTLLSRITPLLLPVVARLPLHLTAARASLLLAAWILVSPATAQPPEGVEARGPSLLDLAILEDPAGTLTPGEAAAAAGWKPSPAGLSASYSDSVWWLRFTVAGAGVGRPHAVLRMRPHYLDELRLYRVTDAAPEEWPVQIGGDHLPAATRLLGGLVPAFLLDDASPEAQHYLLRLRTTSAASLQLELLDEHAYLDAAENEALLIGMDLGLQVVVLLLLAVQCWITRHRLAVLMTLAVAMYFVWRDNINGLLAATLFAESAWLADLGVKVGIYLSAGALAVLMYALGDPLALSLRMRRLVGGFALLSLACVVLAIAGIFTPVVRIYLPLGVGFCAALLLMLARNRSLSPRRRRQALLGMGMYTAVSAATVGSLMMPGIPPTWTAGVLYVSSLIYVGTLAGLYGLMRREEAERETELRSALSARAAELAAREHAAREQGDLLRMLAHELKTPLAVTRLAGEALRTLLPAPAPAVAQRLARIDSATTTMNALVEKCLLLDRVEGFSRLQRERCELGTLVGAVVADCRAPERVHADVQAGLCPECDPDLLRIVMANLVDNALKYSPPDTPVQVRTRAEDGAVHIEVHNEGPPLSPEDIARLFDRFWRARHGQNIPGVGLGLYLVRKIMRLHGGDAVARSAVGEGTTLRVSLPG
ncbi:hypothetical protein FG147_07165 [Thauera sp. UPWRP]|nr:hypothetical protein FG147_07165 [Thauera sp. UPWRP]